MSVTPFPPIIDRPLPDKFGAGMDNARTELTGNTTIHSMVGTLDGSDAWFRLPWVHAATNYGIGGALDPGKDGVIYRWVATPGNRRPWASGPWNHPGYGDGLAYVNTYGIGGINGSSESIEESGQISTPMTAKQWQSTIWLCAAISHKAGRGWEEFSWNMHHREFTTPAYKDCPFPRVYNYTEEYQRAIVNILKYYEGAPMREEFAVIAGLKIALPLGQKPTTPPSSKPPEFVAFAKPRRAKMHTATIRQYGNTTATILGTVQAGSTLWFDGYYVGQEVNGDARWYVVDNDKRGRVHSSGIAEWLPDEPEKLKRFQAFAGKFPAEIRNRETAGRHM